jgi:uncharacterized membrane protein
MTFFSGTYYNKKQAMQNKKYSLIEAISNTIIGLITSFIIQIIIYPLLNIEVSIGQNILITFIFFLASIIRGYFIRRLFNRLK